MAEPISNQLDRLAGGVEGMALHKNPTQPWCSQIVMLAQPPLSRCLAGGVEGMALHKNLTQPWCSQIVMLAQPMPNHALSGVDDANVLQQ